MAEVPEAVSVLRGERPPRAYLRLKLGGGTVGDVTTPDGEDYCIACASFQYFVLAKKAVITKAVSRGDTIIFQYGLSKDEPPTLADFFFYARNPDTGREVRVLKLRMEEVQVTGVRVIADPVKDYTEFPFMEVDFHCGGRVTMSLPREEGSYDPPSTV